jgi:hypothetical protein
MSSYSSQTIIFDCDGVICNFIQGFYDWYQSNHYESQYGHISQHPLNWNFDWQGETAVLYSLITQYIQTRPLLKLIDPNWPQMMLKLKEKYQIVIVSQYPDYEGRMANLTHLGILKGTHYDQLICAQSTDIKVMSIYDLQPRYYVEDAPHVIRQLLQSPITWKLDIYVPYTYLYSNQLPNDTTPHPAVNLVRYHNSEDLLNAFLNSEPSSS